MTTKDELRRNIADILTSTTSHNTGNIKNARQLKDAVKELTDFFTHYLAEAEREAYRNGYNDNARECNCDYLPVGHQHILDDGQSHSIKPQLNKAKGDI